MGIRRKPLWNVRVAASFADGTDFKQEAQARGDDFEEAMDSVEDAIKSPADFDAEGKDLIRLKLEVERV